MKTIIAALALLTLFGFTDRPQQTGADPKQIVISEGFAARPRIIVVRLMKERINKAFYQSKHIGGGKKVEK